MGFQSTLPMRGETDERGGCVYEDEISIHSPHAGRDYRDMTNYQPGE